MEQWLTFARGPLFIATFTFMVLGLGRLVFMEVYQMIGNWLRMRDRNVPWRKNLIESVYWLIPTGKLTRFKPVMSVTSFLFHIAVIVTPIFLVEHMLLWKSGLGLGFNLPAIGAELADFLTLGAIVTGLILLAVRIFDPRARAISDFWDYALLVIIVIPFVTGFIVMHPSLLFTRMQTMLTIHILSGELIFVLMPFTKLAHVVLFPFTRVSSDFYWRFPAEGPRRVAKALHGDEVSV